MSIRDAVACIRRHKRFLITAHTNLEGDALGSELALYLLLKKLGKSARIVNQDATPPAYSFLPAVGRIRRLSGSTPSAFDCFVAVDCSNLKRCGEVSRFSWQAKELLNIDHHVSNERFGNANWVDHKVSSAAEMIYHLYVAMAVALDRQSALCLYVGMMTDTGSFHYSNTNASTHQIAAKLLAYGFDVTEVYRRIYESMPLADAKLLCALLPTIRLSAQGRIAWFQVPEGIVRKEGVFFDLSEQLLKFARSIQGVEIAAVFRQNLSVRHEIKVNLRSQGKVDVNKVAALFGGGGHPTASGCTIKGPLAVVRRRVLQKIRSAL